MTGPLSDQHLDEIRRRDILKGRGESATTMTQVHIDRRVLLAELDRLRAENEQLADLDAATTRRAELQAERDRAVQRWHDEHKRAERLADTRDYALTLLRRFVDDEPCRLDHGGFCQSHGCEPPCRNAEARLLLDGDARTGATA